MLNCLVVAAVHSTVDRQPTPEPLNLSNVPSVHHDHHDLSVVFS